MKESKPTLNAGPIDIHAHYLPPELLTLCDLGSLGPGVKLSQDGKTVNVNGYLMPRDQHLGSDASERRLNDMDKAGIAVQLISPNPIFFHYWDEPERALRVCQVMNDGMAVAVARFPTRLLGLSIIPLQDMDRALQELDRACRDLKLNGVEIGSHVNGRDLDDPSLEPFFAYVERNKIPVQVHPCPHNIAGRERMTRYHLRNLIGNLVETSIAMASVAFGGVLDRHPGLKIQFEHGAGLVPYQIGRWDHGYGARPEARLLVDRPPSEFFKQCWIDTIIHSDAALAYLMQVAGPGRVLLGTDYPADMADPEPVQRIRRVIKDPGLADAVLFRNAYTWLGMEVPNSVG